MALHDNKSPDEDWVDRWSRNLAAAIQRGWPPTRDWVKLRGEELALGAKVLWPPTRDWIKYWWRRTDIAVTRGSRSYGRSIRKSVEASASAGSSQDLINTTERNVLPAKEESINPFTGEPSNIFKPATQATANKVIGWGCLLMAALVVFGLFKSCSSDDMESAEGTKYFSEFDQAERQAAKLDGSFEQKHSAWTEAEYAVKEKLGYNVTFPTDSLDIKFRSMLKDREDVVSYLGYGRYRVEDLVDTPNGVRYNFVCDLLHDESNERREWYCLNIDFVQQ